jgi:site-specific DNA-cytosine methylase
VEDTLDTITAKDHHRMVTVHLEKGLDHREEVKAFLQTYAGCSNIITLNGEGFIITDITLRMLKPEELARAQGFPEDHLTALEINGEPLTNDARVRLIGNSVVPQVAEALIRVNLGGT